PYHFFQTAMKPTMFTEQSLRQRNDRRGVATVEFALTVPILFLLVMGAIEFSRANMLYHTASVAASEGARRGIIVGTTQDDITAVVQKELSMIGVRDSRVVVDPPVVTADTQLVTVGVE